MISRFHFPGVLPQCGEIALPDAVSHHALRVLRLNHGDAVVLFDGTGGEVEARLDVRGKAVFALLGERCEDSRESPLKLVLVQALASGDKMDWIVQKAVELGAAGVIPVQAERSVLRLSGERASKRHVHWQQVAVAACEQCGLNRVPEIGPVQSLAAYLSSTPGVRRLILAPGATQTLTTMQPPGSEALHLMIGPEGGWAEAELTACRAAGAEAIGLGPRVLRTETAGLAVLASLQARWGDL